MFKFLTVYLIIWYCIIVIFKRNCKTKEDKIAQGMAIVFVILPTIGYLIYNLIKG